MPFSNSSPCTLSTHFSPEIILMEGDELLDGINAVPTSLVGW